MAEINFGTSGDRINFNWGSSQVKQIHFGEDLVWVENKDITLTVDAPANCTVSADNATFGSTATLSSSGAPGSAYTDTLYVKANSGYTLSGDATLSSTGDALPSDWTFTETYTSGFGNTMTMTITGTYPEAADDNISETVEVHVGGSEIVASSTYMMHHLVVGAGGNSSNGGGGAGGVNTSYASTNSTWNNTYQKNQTTLNKGTTYSITVGLNASGTGISSISGTGLTTIEAAKGGGGGGGQYGAYGGTSGAPTAHGGNTGAAQCAGGGGGANGSGGYGNTGGGSGGASIQIGITGTNTNYAGGGGGRCSCCWNGIGSGGGTYKGDGGRGGGAGVDGIVVIRVATANFGSQTGGTTSTSGSDTIISWTGNGTYTA